MISDLQHEPLERDNMQEEEEDPQVVGDTQEDHRVHREDHQMCHLEEITIETEMILKEMRRAVI